MQHVNDNISETNRHTIRKISSGFEGELRVEPILAADLPLEIKVLVSGMVGFRGHKRKWSSREVLDPDFLAVQALDGGDIGIADAGYCHLPLTSLGLERDRHEFDAEHFGHQTSLRRKRAAWLERKDRTQCLALRRPGT